MTTTLSTPKAPQTQGPPKPRRLRAADRRRSNWCVKVPVTRAEREAIFARLEQERFTAGITGRLLFLAWARGQVQLPI